MGAVSNVILDNLQPSATPYPFSAHLRSSNEAEKVAAFQETKWLGSAMYLVGQSSIG